MDYVSNMAQYYDSLFYVLIAKIRLRREDLSAFGLEDLKVMLTKYKHDQMKNDIWDLQVNGIDASKIYPYSDYIRAQKKASYNKKAHLGEKEAKQYKNIFDGILKNGR